MTAGALALGATPPRSRRGRSRGTVAGEGDGGVGGHCRIRQGDNRRKVMDNTAPQIARRAVSRRRAVSAGCARPLRCPSRPVPTPLSCNLLRFLPGRTPRQPRGRARTVIPCRARPRTACLIGDLCIIAHAPRPHVASLAYISSQERHLTNFTTPTTVPSLVRPRPPACPPLALPRIVSRVTRTHAPPAFRPDYDTARFYFPRGFCIC